VGDDVIGIDDFHIMAGDDVASPNHAFTFLVQGQGDFATVVQLEHDTLEVQQDVNNIFLHPVQGRVLVQHAFDTDLGRGTTRALPSVWPKPRSNGSMTTRASTGDTLCTSMMRGFSSPLFCIGAISFLSAELLTWNTVR
jgi:hypothetical protein